jgi:L-fuconolactonase
MVFEIPGVFPDHLKHTPALAQAVPDLTIVLDHLSKPPIKLHSMSPWVEQLQAAGAFPNVYAKISGLNTAADWETWSAKDIKPYIDAAIETLGAKRVMFGSDWPVCNLAGGFQAVWEETQRALDGRSSTEIDAVLGKTAEDVYRL